MRKWWLSSVVLLAACASGGGERTPDAAADGLHRELDAAAGAYRDALAAAAAGSEAGDAVTAARRALLDAATRCQRTPGCGGERVVGVYDALLAHEAEGQGGEEFVVPEDETRTAGESPVVAAVPAAGETVALLKGRDLREMVTLNAPMKAAMTEWLTWMRPQLIDAWVNYQYMRQLMWPEYERAGLPEALLFGILAKESGGRVHAVSRAGAAGPLQFMPATGRRFGLGTDPAFDTRFDPQLAARANVAYLEERFAELNGNLELALAAYNGGEGRIGRISRAHPGKTFWDTEVFSQLPKETRDYVPFVMAAAWLFLHAEEYGLHFPEIDRGELVQLQLERATTVNELAICLGDSGNQDGWFRVLRNLNPRYQTSTPLAAGTWLRVPPRMARLYRGGCLDGARAAMARDLASASMPEVAASRPAAVQRYTVKRGDTLGGIAGRHGCASAAALGRANGLKAPYPIRPGQTLSLAGCAR
ncbi:lytic transglycosylase domain-containing protein [Coralloluteibacterium stylophorae]|uniref:Transglycosylase SLT domain-containing protein n=1 Tax=Coralloluteibacterium stylophorae TaxID=1776034 RepID=A0A8J7VUP0_9GAMM|nr:lytic transglycosylase domain-containing protein [Coralloluteibacterium stylophorae]MBS7458605.1 transglycosylase SLT domain-containing protein [Coralloluteibacterium stylophorae]